MAYSAPTYTHDPQAVLDYPIDWADWLDDLGDTIDTATVSVTDGPDDDLAVDAFPFVPTSAVGTVWISWAGTTVPTAKYRVTMHVVTAANREDDRSIFIKIKER